MDRPIEPSIVCDYGPLTMPGLFMELNKMMQGVLPDGTIRVISHQRQSLEHVLAWSHAHEHTLLWQGESRECGGGSCSEAYEFVIQRGPE